MDRKEITHTVDMFHLTLKLFVETPKNPFIAPKTMKFIKPFLKITTYQGNVDKVSAFFRMYLAQSWQIMSKIFHAAVNRVHADYASLLWWDFLHCVQQKKDVIQYPRFTKLIIDDLIKKTPSAHRTNTSDVDVDDFVQKRRESKLLEKSSLRKSLNITIKQKKLSTTLIPPPSDDREKDEIAEATLLDLTIEFSDSIFINEEEDSGTRLELESHKENPKTVDDDNDVEEKKDDKNDDDNDDDDTDRTLVKDQVTGSLETRNEKMHALIPSPLEFLGQTYLRIRLYLRN
nr:hypothetical protein [Tanacetum cinerariifolium]